MYEPSIKYNCISKIPAPKYVYAILTYPIKHLAHFLTWKHHQKVFSHTKIDTHSQQRTTKIIVLTGIIQEFIMVFFEIYQVNRAKKKRLPEILRQIRFISFGQSNASILL